jgi:hypothetical protein
MSSENIKEANKYVAELTAKISDYKRFNKEKIQPYFRRRQKERKPPKEFVDSSFLYIRSYDGDVGIRPFSGINFWNSPDITVAPLNDLNAYTKVLDAGKSYQFSCNVRNRGDLIVPSAKVEFYFCDPTLGFDTRLAVKMGVTAGWVNPYSTTKVALNYTIPADYSGHKCLFARVFSFSPLDLPIDDYQLVPTLDRHVGQLNLNITPQATTYSFNLVHFPNALEMIELLPMNAEEVFALRHPFLADFKINTRAAEFIAKAEMSIEEKPDSRTETKKISRGNRTFFYSRNDKGMSLDMQKAVWNNLMKALKAKNKGYGSSREFEQVFRAFREMNKQVEQSRFELQIPNMGLKPGEATAIKIVATNRVTRAVKGGITLIITN